MNKAEVMRLSEAYPENPTHSPEQWSSFLNARGINPESFFQGMEMTDRYVDTHRDTTYSGGIVNLHSHHFYELLCCRSNCGAEYLVGTDRYRLQKGDIVIVAPGVSHRPILPEQMQEPYQRDVIWISPEFAAALRRTAPESLVELPRHASLLRTAGTRWEYLAEMFQKGVAESERKDPLWHTVVIGNTIVLISQLYRALLSGDVAPLKEEKPELLDRVMEYVEKHLAEKLTLGEIARYFYVSESTVSKTFQQKMGVSFYRCVTQRRLIAARNLILEGILLEHINEQVGFADYSTFYRAFKREYGISPRQFRRAAENQVSL